ncbi:MAG: transcriptional regulator, partial [Prevotella sp.]|nr:transcriptional regulator [Prevotella sp.]
LQPYVDEFISYAKSHTEQTFLVTPIGCGIAGFTPQEIAPLFRWAKQEDNIHLPQEFWEEIG